MNPYRRMLLKLYNMAHDIHAKKRRREVGILTDGDAFAMP